MMELFENAGLISRNDLTFSMLMKSMGDRRFNSCTFLSEKEVDLQFESMFIFSEIKVLEECGYYMRPFGKENRFLSVIHQWDKKRE